eukprot:gene11628-8016_t
MLLRVTDPDEDNRKVYTFEGGLRFDVPARYVPQRIVGRGSYGVVCCAIDEESKREDGEPVYVAIKKINRLFEDLENSKRVLREIKVLTYLNHPNIMNVRDIPPIREVERQGFRELYIVSDYMLTNLSWVHVYNDIPLNAAFVLYITYQILDALSYIHQLQIVHRDIKPANILVNYDCTAQVCDFGLARGLLTRVGEKPMPSTSTGMLPLPALNSAEDEDDDEDEDEDSECITHYVFTRHYRAPELILGNVHGYDYAVDMWALGCLVPEIITGKTLFPGRDYIHQITTIASTLGYKNIPLHLCSSSARKFLDAIASRLPMDRLSWDESHPELKERFFKPDFYLGPTTGGDEEDQEDHPVTEKEMTAEYETFVDFLSSTLQYDASKRLTAAEAMAHPWLQWVEYETYQFDRSQPPFRWEQDEPVRDERTGRLRPRKLNMDQLREMFLEELDRYQKRKEKKPNADTSAYQSGLPDTLTLSLDVCPWRGAARLRQVTSRMKKTKHVNMISRVAVAAAAAMEVVRVGMMQTYTCGCFSFLCLPYFSIFSLHSFTPFSLTSSIVICPLLRCPFLFLHAVAPFLDQEEGLQHTSFIYTFLCSRRYRVEGDPPAHFILQCSSDRLSCRVVCTSLCAHTVECSAIHSG